MSRTPPHLQPLLLFLLHLTTLLALADDSATMQTLLKSISPPPLPRGWTGNDPCKWSGVKCDNTQGVLSIDLSSQSLSGVLPPDLNQLKSLQTLSLQRNNFSGLLPSFSNLTNLQELHLDNNRFTSLPRDFLLGLTSLQKLSLSDNANLNPWAFPAYLVESQSLTELDASNASLVGGLPDIFGEGKLVNVESIRLSYNNLTGPLPGGLAASGIRNLWLNNQDTGLSGGIEVLGSMTMMEQVWLHKNAFTGPIPDLTNCTSLFDLQLRDNSLTGVIPPSLFSLAALVNVSLSNNKLQGPYPEFRNDVKFVGSNNHFCNPNPGPCDPQVTTMLEIAGDMGYPTKLAELWVGNDACKDWSFVSCDPQKKSVTVVNLAKQNLGGEISPSYGKLSSLIRLYLNGNGLTGTIPSSLTGLSALKLLDVSDNNLSGNVPDFGSNVETNFDNNPLLNRNQGGGGSGPGSGGNSPPSPGQSGGNSTGVIVGIVIAVVIAVSIACFVWYKFHTKKHTATLGRVKDNGSNGKEVASHGSKSGGAKGHGVVGYELTSQNSDGADGQYFQGGSVAISIQVLRQVTNNFSQQNILGRGGFGIVYKGELHDGTQIAVKRMESTLMSTKGLNEFQAEISVLTKVRHRHLVALLGFCINDNERLLVYEYMPQGNLGQHLFEWRKNGKSPLTWKQRATIALDVARGVEYLHTLAQESFIHRDLKASNILLGDNMRAKVSDFGLVKSTPDGKQSIATRLAGTFGYLAPEYAVTGKVSTKVDVYAYGAVLMELIMGRPALDETKSDSETHLVTWFRRLVLNRDAIRKAIDPSLEHDDETFASINKVIELACHCTCREASQRPDMGHAVNVLGPLVEQWTPHEEVADDLRIDFDLSLPEALQRWQMSEGSSTMDYTGQMGFSNTSSTQNGKTFGSYDGR